MDGKPTVALFIDPASHHFLQDRLFDRDVALLQGSDLHAPYVHLKESLEAQGVPVHTADRLFGAAQAAERSVYMSFGLRRSSAELARVEHALPSAFFVFEVPIVEPRLYRDLPRLARIFRRVFSFSDSESLQLFTGERVAVQSFRIPQHVTAVHPDYWQRADRKFIVMINANKRPRLHTCELYTQRLRAVAAFESRSEIDLYGVGWDVPPYQMGATRTPVVVRRAERQLQSLLHRIHPDPLLAAARRAWRGVATSKAEVLSQYRFAVCFENMVLRGCITEKLFDCLYVGTVPVYLGAPEIADVVPPECFIDMRRFSDFDALREHLLELSEADVHEYREAARDYLSSPAYQVFRKEEFTRLIAGIVRADTGLELSVP